MHLVPRTLFVTSVAVVMLACAQDPAPVDAGRADASSPRRDGSAERDGAIRDGAIRDGAIRDGAIRDATTAPPTVVAFPGAEGFGAIATGGRGGRVIKVTTLAASGPGSLQEALNVTEPRIIVFEVSGVIDMGNEILLLPHGDLTIAGQTAPGAGITIRGRFYSEYRDGIDNLIVRHIRVRPPAFDGSDPSQFDGMQFSRNQRMIFDHVSVSFGVDETFDLYNADDVTVQWSTIERAATDNDHNYGLLNGPDGYRIAVHHNLFAHNINRNPAIANGPAEVRNNVVYNVRHGFVHHNPATGNFNIIGNYYRQGPDNSLIPFYFDDEAGNGPDVLGYYLLDNYIDDPGDYEGVVDNPWTTPFVHPSFENLAKPETFRSNTEFDFRPMAPGFVPITTQSPADAYTQVLAAAGALPHDVVTRTTVEETRTRTGSWGARIPADLMAGLTPSTAPTDADDDGMADDWERAHGLDPGDGTDHAQVTASGYTAIEDYINELADGLLP